MKKIISFILTVVMLTSAFTCYVSAGKDYIIPNPPVTVEISSPTVDGNITEDEGWSEPCYMNEDSLYYHYNNALQIWAEVRFALDSSGFYFSADILEGIAAYEPTYDSPSWTDSRCPIREELRNGYTPSGDKFYLHIDPLCKFYDGRHYGGVDYVPEYMVCIDEDEKIHIRGCGNVITEKVLANGDFTEGGWSFEAFIPWEVIVDDVYNVSEPTNLHEYGNYVITTDEIISNRSLIKVGLQYDDQYNTKDGKYATANYYYTPYAENQSGKPFNGGIIGGVDVLGIDITVSNTCRTNGEHDWTNWIRVQNPTSYKEGKEISLCNICGTTAYRIVDKLAVRFNYSDVRSGSWYYNGVLYCVKKGYMNGMSSTRFSPNTALTREQCVLILANIMELNTELYKNTDSGFTDVPTGKWYSGAVAWAVEKGYVSGVSKERFGTGMDIQRAAFARLLYYVAEDMGMDMTVRADLTVYIDHAQIPDWAYEQISWAVANNIITSTKDDALMVSPYAQLTRAQCATMLMKLGMILDEMK